MYDFSILRNIYLKPRDCPDQPWFIPEFQSGSLDPWGPVVSKVKTSYLSI